MTFGLSAEDGHAWARAQAASVVTIEFARAIAYSRDFGQLIPRGFGHAYL